MGVTKMEMLKVVKGFGYINFFEYLCTTRKLNYTPPKRGLQSRKKTDLEVLKIKIYVLYPS